MNTEQDLCIRSSNRKEWFAVSETVGRIGHKPDGSGGMVRHAILRCSSVVDGDVTNS